MSDNWVVQHLQNALETWNSKLTEVWTLFFALGNIFPGAVFMPGTSFEVSMLQGFFYIDLA